MSGRATRTGTRFDHGFVALTDSDADIYRERARQAVRREEMLKLILYSAALAAAIGGAQHSAARGARVAPARDVGVVTGERWLLVYDGGRTPTHYDSASYALMLTGAGRCTTQLFTGAIFLALQRKENGHWFTSWVTGGQRLGPATGEDWESYIGTLTAPNGPLQQLDRGAAGAGLARPLDVAVMLPYLGNVPPRVSVFSLAGRDFAVDSAAGRDSAYAAYITLLLRRITPARYPHLRLRATYWLSESVKNIDTAVVASVARTVHGDGLRFLWIPYSGARNLTRWRALGFDEAWFQPNYFFQLGADSDRVRRAGATAEANGMGLELEFNSLLFSDQRYRERFAPYLEYVRSARPQSVALYDGQGDLSRLLTSKDPQIADQADDLARLLCGPVSSP